MAGNAAPRELTGVRFAVATAADDPAIRRLLRENPMRGGITVSFEREPDYFQGANLAGGSDLNIVGFENGRLACMGRCTRRLCWIDERQVMTGYLAELRVDERAQGRFLMLRNGYRFFHEQSIAAPVEFTFTSIVEDNERARRFLESGLRGMPRYEFLAEFETQLVAIPRNAPRPRLRITAAAPEHLDAMLQLLNSRKAALSTVWTRENLPDLSHFLLGWDGAELAACGALWDQRPFRQTVIRGYGPPLSYLCPVLNALSGVLRIPPLPKPGDVLAHAFLSPLAMAPGAEDQLPGFIASFFPQARQAGLRYLTLGNVPPRALREFAARSWRSRLYRVDWPEDKRLDLRENGPFLPDIALL